MKKGICVQWTINDMFLNIFLLSFHEHIIAVLAWHGVAHRLLWKY